ncbi:Septum site-determining protein MinC [Buchnera aphidicola (Eriosoma grossulariae)]|uniref:septum site-determining protein MinC n=1 Tax=Buchnera aphidicola TaxID=9 RepID=UPI003464CF66
MQSAPIKLNSSCFTFLILYLFSYNVNLVKTAIQIKINQLPYKFINLPIVLNVSSLSNQVNWIEMKKAILSTGIYIIGVMECHDEKLKKMIINSGLPILSNYNNYFFKKKYIKSVNNNANDQEKRTKKTLIINTPIRSGQKIYAQNRDLIITSHVSSGAELIADGNVHIYGIMRGRVLVGAKGDTSRQIFCTNFFAELISISGEYWLIDHIPLNYIGKTVIIFLKNGLLKIKLID